MAAKISGKLRPAAGAWFAAALLAGASPCGAAGRSKVLYDRYYVLTVLQQRMGYVHAVMTQQGDEVTTKTETHMSIAKLGNQIDIRSTAVEVETWDGKPLRSTQEQQVGSMTTSHDSTVFEGQVATYTQVEPTGRKTTKAYHFDKLPMLSHGTVLAMRAGGMKVGNKVTVLTYNPEFFPEKGAAEFSYQYEAEEEIPILGLPLKVVRARRTCAGMPMLGGTTWLDFNGVSVKEEVPMVANAVMMMTSRQKALRPADDAHEGDLFGATLVKLGRPLKDYMTRPELTVEITGHAATKDLLAQTDHQDVQVLSRGQGLRVTIHRDAQAKSKATPEELAALTRPTDLVESDNAKIVALAAKLTAGMTDPTKKVEAIRLYVRSHMKPGNAAGAGAMMDSAAKVVDSMSGDCTEYAVLTAALCRAAGIPARVLMGIVYVPRFAGQGDVFGYHAWTEVHYGGRWHGADATRKDPFDVGHLAFLVSDGNKLAPQDMLRMAATMGELELHVVDVATTHPTARAPVQRDAAPVQ